MAIEYKGEETLFVVEIEGDDGAALHRPFNQTGGSVNIAADSVELSTKDKTGSDYGDVTQRRHLKELLRKVTRLLTLSRRKYALKNSLKFTKLIRVLTQQNTECI